MFFTLLIVTFVIAVAVSSGAVRLFDRPIASILRRIVTEELSGAWHRYIKFAAYVVGVSAGVRIHRVAANRWTLARTSEGWRIESRKLRPLDGSQPARDILEQALAGYRPAD